MAYEIDQSGKVEDTSKDTILSLTNGRSYSIVIPAKVKKKLQVFFRKSGTPRKYVLFVFSIGIQLLINVTPNKNTIDIFIDMEYPGKDPLIIGVLKKLMPANKRNIYFTRVGKRSRAHYLCYGIATKRIKYTKKTKDIKNITYGELKKTCEYLSP